MVMQIIGYTLLFILSLTLLSIRDAKRDHLHYLTSFWVSQKQQLYEQINQEIIKTSFDKIPYKHKKKGATQKKGEPKPERGAETEGDPEETDPTQESAKKKHTIAFDSFRPPSNGKLNLAFIDQEPYKSYLFSSLKSLFYTLYQNTIPAYILDQVLIKLEDSSDEIIFFCYPDELASLDFKDPLLQKTFYHMMKGSSTIPSLLEFISIDCASSPTLNLMFAPKEILSLFFEEGTVKELIEIREAFFKIFEEKTSLSKQELQEAFRDQVKPLLPQRDKEPHYDFSLGKPGNMLTIKEESGETLYQKVPFLF